MNIDTVPNLIRQAYSLLFFCPERNLADSISEHDRVICTDPIPRLGLAAGATGVVVHTHGQGLAYEVEFMREDGTTMGVETVELTRAEMGPFEAEILTSLEEVKLHPELIKPYEFG